MIPIEFGTQRLRDEPAAGERHTGDGGRRVAQSFFPAIEVHRPRVRAQSNKLGKSEIGADRSCSSGIEGFRAVAGQSENKRPEDVHATSAKNFQALDQKLSGEIEIFVDIFQARGRYRFHSDQSALDARCFHGIEEVGVFGGFHGDLSKEHHVIRQLGQARHEFKSLRPQVFEFSDPRSVLLEPGEVQVGESDGIEIVIGQRDEAESETAQLDHFFDDCVRSTLSGALAIGAPD